MGNPRIIEKVMFTLIGMLIVLIAVTTYGSILLEQDCKDAGGTRVGEACINPAAIIEVK